MMQLKDDTPTADYGHQLQKRFSLKGEMPLIKQKIDILVHKKLGEGVQATVYSAKLFKYIFEVEADGVDKFGYAEFLPSELCALKVYNPFAISN